MATLKPCSEACVRNREPLLAVLRAAFAEVSSVLEIGSGTGQHAVYFARHLPHLVWQTSDLAENFPAINAWIDAEGSANVRRPLLLDVWDAVWPVTTVDAVFSANSLHIMDWRAVTAAFVGMGRVVQPGGMVAIYGPFNENGSYTSQSNARFDADLRARGVGSALRDLEAVDALAHAAGFALVNDVAMPANNRTLVWQRTIGVTPIAGRTT